MNDTKQPVARARGEASKGSGPWLVVGLVVLAILLFFGAALATFLRYQAN